MPLSKVGLPRAAVWLRPCIGTCRFRRDWGPETSMSLRDSPPSCGGTQCLAERRSHANRHGVEMPGRARDRASALPRMATEDAEDSGDTMAWRLGGCRGARALGAGRAPSWSEELWLERVAPSDVVSARSWPPGPAAYVVHACSSNMSRPRIRASAAEIRNLTKISPPNILRIRTSVGRDSRNRDSGNLRPAHVHSHEAYRTDNRKGFNDGARLFRCGSSAL